MFFNLFKTKPRLKYTLSKICKICFKEIPQYASLCSRCATKE